MKFRLIAFLVLASLCACANPETPPGGPADTFAPQILQVSPTSGTTFFDGSAIELQFDEWVRSESLTENIFVSPPAEFEINWSGPNVEIEFTEELAPNTTYAVTIGAAVRDYRGNSADRSTTIILATGAVLDSGIVRGRVFDAQDGAFVFLYPLQNLDRDTLDPRHTAPRYLTQLGKTGDFEFQALAPGDYRVFVVDDSFRNRLFDPGSDGWGMASADLSLEEGQTLEGTVMRLRPAEDLLQPLLYEVRPLGPRKYAAVFNEKLDEESLRPESFSLQDSAGTSTVELSAVHMDTENPSSVILYTADSLAWERRWSLDAFAVRDSAGNAISDTASIVIFSAAERIDTNRPRLVQWPFKGSQSGLQRSGFFDLKFSDALRPPAGKTLLRLYDEADSVFATAVTQPRANVLRLNIEDELPSGVVLKLEVRATDILALNGRSVADSNITRIGITRDPREFGDAAGKLTTASEYSGNYVLQLQETGDGGSADYQVSFGGTEAGTAWSIPAIRPGQYDIFVFRDTNGNGRYDYGRVFPFEPAEEFRIFPGILRVKPRWTTQDINLAF